MALGEVDEVGRVGACPGVDGLGRVADHADVLAAAEPQVEQALLQRADILVLIYYEGAVLPADLGCHPLVLGEDGDRAEQYVLQVDPAALELHVLVRREDAGDRGGVEGSEGAGGLRGELGVVVGADVADLGPLDLAGQVAQGWGVDADAAA